MTAHAFPTGTILGYPRIGRRRELKRAVEEFWAGTIDAAELEARAAELRAATRERLASLGLGRADSAIPESFSYHDQVLDAAVAVGAVPSRFAGSSTPTAASTSPVLHDRPRRRRRRTARDDEVVRLELPLPRARDRPRHRVLSARRSHPRRVRRGEGAGFLTRPVIVGPVTFLLLAKAADGAPAGFRPLDRLADLVPVYAALLERLEEAGAEWVQLDEPALVSESIDEPRDRVLDAAAAYDTLGALRRAPAIFVAAPYGARRRVAALAATPVEAIGLDLVRGTLPQLDPATESLARRPSSPA